MFNKRRLTKAVLSARLAASLIFGFTMALFNLNIQETNRTDIVGTL